MPSHVHEALIELFRQRPALAAELLRGQLGVAMPSYAHASVGSSDLTDLTPTEYRADAVTVLTSGDAPVGAVVIEVQLRRDPAKRWSWPVYLTTLRARLQVPVVLLVVCPDSAVATWCAASIDLGHPDWALRPVVIAPDRVPVLTDPEEAVGKPELAVLSAMAHGAGIDGDKVLSAFLAGLRALSDDQANLYTDLVLMTLPAAARARLEELMSTGTYEYKSEFARRYYGQGREEGRAEGEARAVLGVLEVRGISVPDAARERIMQCLDLEQLETWVRRAVTVSTIEELFA
ncbi:hypothetical protein [Actinophytocola algeriensis]|uniref:Uncharacterized protein n=1 Tax=Actinophytocola algeriensis TaxID=1768010 RepID=A0A7W7VE33_9PSEU|nr:hypothetical protein [Actinophytocola algeriensis]MBB4906838.1 hypothetical protein [Actinophytocola algeriensis]MBE1478319.1 hypothetical protein [Actinophytocola algeriensis]